jgi:uncharacterized membrane protein
MLAQTSDMRNPKPAMTRRKKVMSWIAQSPELMFLVFAGIVGLLLVALIPPALGGNETYNLQRAVSVASFQFLIEPVALPSGIELFINEIWQSFPAGSKPPYSYDAAQFQRAAGIPLKPDEMTMVSPNAIAVLHPFSYLPQAPFLWLGLQLGLSPMLLLYVGRLAGLAAGVTLTFAAIRVLPFQKHALAALALLPTVTFSRSTLDADQLTTGLAFLFAAMTIREIVADGPISRKVILQLAALAFVLAQCKSAYLLLPFFVLAIPQVRFGDFRRKSIASALIIIPGLLGSVAWMMGLKYGFFSGAQYTSSSGPVFPDLQMKYILSEPISYLCVLARTVFATPLITNSFIGIIGLFGPPVMLPVYFYPILGAAFAAVLMNEAPFTAPALRTAFTRSLALSLFVGSTGIILTLLYLQWNTPRADTIDGFQGRYLYPLLPFLLVFLSGGKSDGRRLDPALCLAAFALISVSATCWTTWSTYLA